MGHGTPQIYGDTEPSFPKHIPFPWNLWQASGMQLEKHCSAAGFPAGAPDGWPGCLLVGAAAAPCVTGCSAACRDSVHEMPGAVSQLHEAKVSADIANVLQGAKLLPGWESLFCEVTTFCANTLVVRFYFFSCPNIICNLSYLLSVILCSLLVHQSFISISPQKHIFPLKIQSKSLKASLCSNP